mmetsp:Transcript_128749/g.252167  ORF Transcript_128749/g.252167 Transcript_128749/m.252167 type:complete len:206 (+) Transcript_128749:147-764(+)
MAMQVQPAQQLSPLHTASLRASSHGPLRCGRQWHCASSASLGPPRVAGRHGQEAESRAPPFAARLIRRSSDLTPRQQRPALLTAKPLAVAVAANCMPPPEIRQPTVSLQPIASPADARPSDPQTEVTFFLDDDPVSRPPAPEQQPAEQVAMAVVKLQRWWRANLRIRAEILEDLVKELMELREGAARELQAAWRASLLRRRAYTS